MRCLRKRFWASKADKRISYTPYDGIYRQVSARVSRLFSDKVGNADSGDEFSDTL